MSDTRVLPDDVATLQAELAARDAELAAACAQLAAERAKVAARDARIEQLEHRIHVLAKWVWGPRTEKRAPQPAPAAGRAWLPFADLLDAAQRLADRTGAQGTIEVELPESTAPNARAQRRSEFPEHLPRVRTTIEVAEADRLCCGQPMEPMGMEVTQELERLELAVVHEIARTKYCCRTCQMQVLTAPLPTRPLPKALLGAGWLAQLAVERFGNHLPYHRLERKYESEGLALSRTVLSRSAIELAGQFEPVHAALSDEVVRSGVVFADETSGKVRKSRDGPARRVWMWVYASKEGEHYFDYDESRGSSSPERVLSGFRGWLHDDGYCVYETALDPARVRHVACWAHVRRKFVDARDKDPQIADEAVEWIARLYAIDSEAKERELGAEGLHALRQERAPAVLAGFKEWLGVRQTQVLPQSPVGAAIRYALGRWEALGHFLEDGRLELDNNRAERGLRAVAVGRKNWMFYGNERGGRTAAVFYSLIATCKARGIDPKVYLHDAMLRLAEGVDPATLTPREWQARYGAEVEARRSYVLAQILPRLAT